MFSMLIVFSFEQSYDSAFRSLIDMLYYVVFVPSRAFLFPAQGFTTDIGGKNPCFTVR